MIILANAFLFAIPLLLKTLLSEIISFVTNPLPGNADENRSNQINIFGISQWTIKFIRN